MWLRSFYFLVVVKCKVFSLENIHLPNTQWHFLDKFCFDEAGGEIEFDLQDTSSTPEGQEILVYHDMNTAFPSVYQSENSCEHKRGLSVGNGRLITSKWASQRHKFKLKNIRPRWWFIVLANCNSTEEMLELRYIKITYTNKAGTHFSKDEEGLLPAMAWSAFALLVLLVLCGVSFCKTDPTSDINRALGLIVLVVASELLAVFLRLEHRISYAKNGVGQPAFEQVGLLLSLIPDAVLTALLVLMAKGWQLTSRAQLGSWRGLVEVMVLYVVINMAVVYWGSRKADPVLVLSMYQEWPGTVLCLLRGAMLIWVLGTLASTWKQQRRVRGGSLPTALYVGVLLLECLHFLTVPVVVLVAHLLQPWNRHKEVVGAELALQTLCYYLLWAMFGIRGIGFNKGQKGILFGMADVDEDDQLELDDELPDVRIMETPTMNFEDGRKSSKQNKNPHPSLLSSTNI